MLSPDFLRSCYDRRGGKERRGKREEEGKRREEKRRKQLRTKGSRTS
jgi:hypothetical protein